MSSLTTKDVSFRVIDLNTKIERYLKKIQKKCSHKIIFGKHHRNDIDENLDYYICPNCGKRDTSFEIGGWNLSIEDVKWISGTVFDSIFQEKEIVLLVQATIDKILEKV